MQATECARTWHARITAGVLVSVERCRAVAVHAGYLDAQQPQLAVVQHEADAVVLGGHGGDHVHCRRAARVAQVHGVRVLHAGGRRAARLGDFAGCRRLALARGRLPGCFRSSAGRSRVAAACCCCCCCCHALRSLGSGRCSAARGVECGGAAGGCCAAARSRCSGPAGCRGWGRQRLLRGLLLLSACMQRSAGSVSPSPACCSLWEISKAQWDAVGLILLLDAYLDHAREQSELQVPV
jgi:hypothetical protein